MTTPSLVKVLLLLSCVIINRISCSIKHTITTSLGQITGNLHHHSSNLNNDIYEFLGIQYAKAPIGNLRFRPSQLLNTPWNTSYNATSYGPWCIQSNKPNSIQSENCLFLNIWTPQINSSQLLPVQFWIHGGAFIHGSGSDASFNGINFVSKAKNIVLVTINYRLGPLGFLQSKQLFDEDPNWKSYGGMNGIFDQIQALNWVKRYISDFGGNPDKITIFGESAGGLSVCMLMISPLVQTETFQRAIQQSGACTGPWSAFPQYDGLQQTISALEAHNMSTNVTDLRKLSAFEFQWDSFNPSVDGLVLNELPIQTYAHLNDDKTVFNAQELIIGFNSMDGIIGYPFEGGSTPNTSSEYHNYIGAYIKNQSQIELIETVYYPLSDFTAYDGRSSASIAWQTINGDVCVSCPTLVQMMNIVQQKDNFKGFVYEFRGGAMPFYAPHASEIPFIFDHESNETFFDVKWNQNLSDSMLLSWANFGKYGNPNMNVNGEEFEWTEFGLNDDGNVIVFDDDIRMEKDYLYSFRHNACSFWYNEVGLIPTMQQICYDLNP